MSGFGRMKIILYVYYTMLTSGHKVLEPLHKCRNILGVKFYMKSILGSRKKTALSESVSEHLILKSGTERNLRKSSVKKTLNNIANQ